MESAVQRLENEMCAERRGARDGVEVDARQRFTWAYLSGLSGGHSLQDRSISGTDRFSSSSSVNTTNSLVIFTVMFRPQ